MVRPIVEMVGDIDENRKIGIAAFSVCGVFYLRLPLSIVTLPGGMSLERRSRMCLAVVLAAKLFVDANRLRV